MPTACKRILQVKTTLKDKTIVYLCSYQCYAQAGGGGPRDEVGSLIIRAHPTWGILANFEQKCWPWVRKFE